MKKIIHYLLICSLLFVAVVACNHPDAEVTPSSGTGTATGGTGTGTGTVGGTGGGTGGGNTTDTALCFERDILPIFISNCAKSGCHDAVSAQEGYVFVSYATITSKKFRAGDPSETELYKKITDNDPKDIMPPPPNAALTQQQKILIYNWIARGAPNTTGCSNGGCDTTKFTFLATVQPTINQYCKGCHNSTSAPNGVNFDSYTGVKVVANDGRLVKVINHAAGVPAMPQGGNKLPDCQIKQIEKWVAAGAQNN